MLRYLEKPLVCRSFVVEISKFDASKKTIYINSKKLEIKIIEMNNVNSALEIHESYKNCILELYDTCKITLFNKIPLRSPFLRIVEWMFENFNVTPLHLTYIAKLICIIFVFKDRTDLEKFIFETEHQFKSVSASMEHYKLFLKDVTIVDNETLNYEYHTFKSLAKMYISLKSDLSQFHNELNISSLWKINRLSGYKIVLFFNSESEARKYEKSENMDHLINKYLCYLKKNDEYDILKKSDIRIIIDSKDNFEVNYLGSMGFYFKDH